MTLPLAQAGAIAGKIRGELAPFCARIEIAGSIRRGRPFCGDIDLVVLPRTGPDISNILRRCGQHAKRLKHGDQYCVFELKNGFTLDLWIAHNGEVRPGDLFENPVESAPCNFGVLLLSRTGSVDHNIWIAQNAKAKGLHFNPHRGVERKPGGRVIAATEEMDIFAALGLEFIPPERRER